MSAPPPPEQPGWYADAQGAWWWWDGRSWTGGAPVASAGPGPGTDRSSERGTALLMWVLYLVVGSWISSLVFYFVVKDKPFVRHHAAESLNLALLLLPFQVASLVLVVPWYLDWAQSMVDGVSAPDPTAGLVAGIVLYVVATGANYGFGILGAVRANKGRWDRLPIGLHLVRGAVRAGAEPYPMG